jgi:hypothetical protein
MAPPRHKRNRSSTSSRASSNLLKTEVTINVYDLLPVSMAGRNENMPDGLRQTTKTTALKQMLTSPQAIRSIYSSLDHWILPTSFWRRPLNAQQRANRVRIWRTSLPTENRRLPHASASNSTGSIFPLQYTAWNLFLATSRNRRHRPADSCKIHGARV